MPLISTTLRRLDDGVLFFFILLFYIKNSLQIIHTFSIWIRRKCTFLHFGRVFILVGFHFTFFHIVKEELSFLVGIVFIAWCWTFWPCAPTFGTVVRQTDAFACFGKTMNTKATQKSAFMKLIKPSKSQEVILFVVSIIDDDGNNTNINNDNAESGGGGRMPADTFANCR